MTEDVDAATLLTLKELLGEKFSELIHTYMSDSVERYNAAKEAFAVYDLDTVNREIHGLKGSSRNIGANKLADICQDLESQAKDGAVEQGEKKLAAVEQHLAAVNTQLSSYL